MFIEKMDRRLIIFNRVIIEDEKIPEIHKSALFIIFNLLFIILNYCAVENSERSIQIIHMRLAVEKFFDSIEQRIDCAIELVSDILRQI